MSLVETVTGQICFKRSLSRKLAFYDLRFEASTTPASRADKVATAALGTRAEPSACGIELLLKVGGQTPDGSWQGLTQEEVLQVRNDIKLGDCVRVTGSIEPDRPLLVVTEVTVLQRWRDICPSASFSPRHLVALQHLKPCSQAQPQSGSAKRPQTTAATQPPGHPGLLGAGPEPDCLNVVHPADRPGQRSAAASHVNGIEEASGDRQPTDMLRAKSGPSASSAKAGQPHDADLAQEQADASASRPGPCKFWLNTGTCLKGDTCKYAHGSLGGVHAERQQWIDSRRRRRREAASDAGDPHGADAQRKRQRAAIFVDWLVKTFGRDLLNRGTGVLDVAGGKGHVSFWLQTLHGIRCTLVDPRPRKLSREQHRELARMRSAQQSADALASDGEPSLAHHGRPDNHMAATQGPGGDCPLLTELESAATLSREAGAGVASSSSDLRFTLSEHIQAEFGPDLWMAGPHAEHLQQCSLVVGLHPDQATDAIVDFALQFGKAFAVVPCCVFPRLFSHRRLCSEGGKERPVVLYTELLEYLQHKSSARREYLPFEGMNQVLYRPVLCSNLTPGV